MKKSIPRKITTVGQLKTIIKEKKLGWNVDDSLSDADPLPAYPVGKTKGADPILNRAPSLEFQEILDAPPTNSFLLDRWRKLGLLKKDVKGNKRK